VPEGAAHRILELKTRLEDTLSRVGSLLEATGDGEPAGSTPPAPSLTPEQVAEMEALAARFEALEPLILDNTFENPLLRGREGHYELTTQARKLLEEFVTTAGLDSSGGTLFTLNRKVARWIEAIPEGMVLMLKVGMLSGRPEVYPRYVPKTEEPES